MSTLTHLEKQILATVVYYDILDYPLTSFEVFLYLVNKNYESRIMNQELSDVCELLNNSEYLKKYLDQKLGFYFLKNRKDIVQQRLNRKKLADQKWKKIKKVFWIMQITPFMRMVLVSGSLALGNSKNESDVDLIIIAKKKRIWIVRTFITLLTSILGVRRYKNKTENKICLNHYITNKSLKIPFESLYNAQSYLHLINIYDSKKDKELFKKFQKENEWIKKYAGNYKSSELGGFRSIKRNKILNFISKISEFILSGEIGNYFENALSKIQSAKIKKDKLYKKSGGRITINNDQLEFHPDSHEANIIPEFNKRIGVDIVYRINIMKLALNNAEC
jgi:predicted nucleotidyltransferase